MSSLRVRILYRVMLSIKRRVVPHVTTPRHIRRIFKYFRTIPPFGVQFKNDAINGVVGEWATMGGDAAPHATILYFHGGAYCFLSAKAMRGATGGFARRGFQVFAPDYRLAPKYSFPAAVEDGLAVWRGLRERVAGPIFIAGDSAGGGLCLALLFKLRDLDEEGPSGACLFSPWTDLATTGASMAFNDDCDPFLASRLVRLIADLYLAGADASNPLASPLYGDYTGLPPLCFFVGDTEVLLDDTLRAAAKGTAAGVRTKVNVEPYVPHAWPILGRLLPESQRALSESVAFFKSCL